MKFDFLGLKKTVASMGEQVRELRVQIETLKRQREELAAAPHSRDDVLAILSSRIDREGAVYAHRLRHAIRPVINRGPGISNDVYVPIMTAEKDNVPAGPKTIENAFCLFFNAQMKEAVAAALAGIEWPDGAVSHIDRVAKLTKLDREIDALEAEETELAKQAAAAGVILA
jgi:hypothetical protein